MTMKNFKELREGMLDDFVSDFESLNADQLEIKYNVLVKAQKRYKPRKYSGSKKSGEDSWVKYVRGPEELKELLSEHQGTSKITLDGIIKLFAENYKAIDERYRPELSVKDIYNVREYDRKLINGFTGTNNAVELADLEASIKKEGIKQPGIITIERQKNGSVTVILGEGNHRLSLALKLGIRTMPIRFHYR